MERESFLSYRGNLEVIKKNIDRFYFIKIEIVYIVIDYWVKLKIKERMGIKSSWKIYGRLRVNIIIILGRYLY